MTPNSKRRLFRFSLRTMFVAVTVVGVLASFAALRVWQWTAKQQAARQACADGIFMNELLLDDVGWQPGDDLVAIRRKLDEADTYVYVAMVRDKKSADMVERTLRGRGIECWCERYVKILPSYTDYAVTVHHRHAKRTRSELRSAPLNMLAVKFLPLDIIAQEQ